MKSGNLGGIMWKSGEDGSLTLEGEGVIEIDTDKDPSEGMVISKVDLPDINGNIISKMSMCPECKQWLQIVNGELVHDELETVGCVLRS